MAVQGALNSMLGKIVGLTRATFVVHILGTAVASLLLLLPQTPGTSLANLGQAPWYALLGGPIGVCIVFFVAASIGKAGVGLATTAIIIAQLLTAYFIDHCGLFGVEHLPFNALKALGIALITAGGWLLLK
jgi:transporter family-2 protein